MEHRVKLAIVVLAGGALGVPLPTYADLAYDDGGVNAWVTVPEEDCPCGFADEAAWHQALDARYAEHAGAFRPVYTVEHHDPAPVPRLVTTADGAMVRRLFAADEADTEDSAPGVRDAREQAR